MQWQEEDMQRYPASPETTYKKGVISLDNVYLGYHLDNRVIVSGLNLTVRPGEKVRPLKILLCPIS